MLRFGHLPRRNGCQGGRSPALLSPFAAVFYPLAVLPQWMQGVAHVLPPAYVFEGMRHAAGQFAIPFLVSCCCKGPLVAAL